MKNLNMGIKLGIGFGVVLLLTCYLGYMAYTDSQATVRTSSVIADEYMPELTHASDLETYMSVARLRVRTYGLNGNDEEYTEGMRAFAQVQEQLKLLQAHSARYPHLTRLAEFVRVLPPLLDSYTTNIAATRNALNESVAIRANMTSLANEADMKIAEVGKAIFTAVQTRLAEQNFDQMGQRMINFQRAEEARRALVDVRRQINAAQISLDVRGAQKASENLQAVENLLAVIKAELVTAAARENLEQTEKAIRGYRAANTQMLAVWSKNNQLADERNKLGEKLTDLTATLTEILIKTTATMLDKSRIEAASSVANTVLVLCVVLVLGLLISFFLTRSITGPLKQGVAFAQAVARGNLDETLAVNSADEVGRLADALRTMVDSLKSKISEANEKSEMARIKSDEAAEAMLAAKAAQAAAESAKREGMLAAAHQLENVVEHIATASNELSVQIEQSERGSGDASNRISETATAMEEMNCTVLEVARNAGQASDLSGKTRKQAEEGASVVRQAIASIQQVQTQSLALHKDMQALTDHAQAISQIMTTISDIADQTNLLALNAAIEAARAGEAGRGFAVVADEVRKLAEKTMISTTDVGNAIRAIQQSAEYSRNQVDVTVKNIDEATQLVNQSGGALTSIVQMVDSTADQVRAIATASEEQSATSEEINRSIGHVNDIAAETSRAMQESARAVTGLAEQAQSLAKLIDEMKRG